MEVFSRKKAFFFKSFEAIEQKFCGVVKN